MVTVLAQTPPQIDFATLDLLPYGVIVVNEAGTIVYYNAREEQIAGRERAAVLGRNFFTEVAPCTQVREFHGRFRETLGRIGGNANFHFRFPFPDNPREVEISLTSFENKGERLCLISVGDVTEREIVREQIIRAERLRELGEVAAGVAHNFNNVLTSMLGNLELLQRHVAGEKAQRLVGNVLTASRDAAQMVKRIQDNTRQQPHAAADLSALQLNDLLQDSLAFSESYLANMQSERGTRIDIELALAAQLPLLWGNAGTLREVFVNLLRNAIDAIERAGRITVRTHVEGAYCVAEISDTGMGMSAEVLQKIFRPLFTTKGIHGTGLGLATCYAIVRQHNGDIRVRSVAGQGTTFSVWLPLQPQTTSVTPA